MELTLDRGWAAGFDGEALTPAAVPGLAADPRVVEARSLRYRTQVDLPQGDWTHATLVLRGARFSPVMFIDGERVASAEGGMAPIVLPLRHAALRPGARITLEIVLAGLDALSGEDASCIPPADRWRSNVASCLWDRVVLRLHGSAGITGVIPCTDAAERRVRVHWRAALHAPLLPGATARVRIIDPDGQCVGEGSAPAAGEQGAVELELDPRCAVWSPTSPVCHRLQVALIAGSQVLDTWEQTWGLRTFGVAGRDFELNGAPVHLRAGSVVWHRWVRDPEARELAWDVDWFERHIVKRLQAHGANALRFHLGTPPEELLDLCDRHGLLVQAEWLFFHGLAASAGSLAVQWPAWFEQCLRHPSVVLLHPWNETEGDILAKGHAALERSAAGFPPLVLAHRDVCHVHKYWWSLFENVGCYYDSIEEFPQPIMVDEFGGNYLDGDAEPGGYPALAGALQRFLGRDHDRSARLQLQCDANARVAEYWRRLGAAGFSPFCILGSPEDGSHHFLGPLREGRPKPVWDALSAAWAPVAASIDLWDRQFAPRARINAPLHLFNDTGEDQTITVACRVVDAAGAVQSEEHHRHHLAAHAHAVEAADFALPGGSGAWRVEAEVLDAPGCARRPISSWRVWTRAVRVPAVLADARIGVSDGDDELAAFLAAAGCTVVGLDQDWTCAVCARRGWRALEAETPGGPLRRRLQAGIHAGRRVVLGDIGPCDLGQGYCEPERKYAFLQGRMWVPAPREHRVELFGGVSLRFDELGEPESCIHPTPAGQALCAHGDHEALRLWNGLRGGLIVPAWSLDVSGLSPAGFLARWRARGADPQRVCAGGYVAYELAGQYAFGTTGDADTAAGLRQRVRFLIEDAPALAASIDPEAAIVEHDLSAGYAQADGEVDRLIPLCECGRDLAQQPVLALEFGPGRGELVLSQAITCGRLADGTHPDIVEPNPHYALRRDPAAQQYLLDLLGAPFA
ncbi:MAG: glycoside hydrolase [Planctomycetota bacterium]